MRRRTEAGEQESQTCGSALSRWALATSFLRLIVMLLIEFSAGLFAVASAQALPLLSEVFYDDVGSDDASIFVEISAESGFDLEGWSLQGVNGNGGGLGPVLALQGRVPEDGLFVVADVTGSGFSRFAAEADLLLNFDLQNGPDSIVLLQGERIVDALGYGVFGPDDTFAGEGRPTLDPPAGWSLARVYADLDSDDNAADFVALETPTPGSASWQAVPEPRSALLAGVGLFVLGLFRRAVVRSTS